MIGPLKIPVDWFHAMTRSNDCGQHTPPPRCYRDERLATWGITSEEEHEEKNDKV